MASWPSHRWTQAQFHSRRRPARSVAVLRARWSGRIADVGTSGARIRVDRALTPGEWIHIGWSPSIREIDAMPAELRPKQTLRARVTREVAVRADQAAGLEYTFAVEFPVSWRQRVLALFDLAVPWIGVAMILAAVSNVVWL